MPPKKPPQASGSKVKDDKTFGMKNKNKSAKVQKQIEIINMQAAQAGKNKETLAKEKERERLAKEKADAEKRKREDAELLKPVMAPQKVPFGVDPKTVLCQYFKASHCDKGAKCKFSHDRDIGRKVDKRDLYADNRDDKMQDTMDNWDDAKLQSVVLSKAGNPRTTTDIVCKYFIQAIETGHYGWFWECPNGDNCMYRHALPPGFVLKSQKKALEDAAKANIISIEEFLEVERHKLGNKLTPVTPETFAVWKKTRMDKKEAELEALRKTKDAQNAAGKNVGMSGKDLFAYNPEWFVDEDEDGEGWDLDDYKQKYREETDDEGYRDRISHDAGSDDDQNHASEAEGDATVGSSNEPPREDA